MGVGQTQKPPINLGEEADLNRDWELQGDRQWEESTGGMEKIKALFWSRDGQED